MIDTGVVERFWARVQRGDPDECWPWIGDVNAIGYGRLYVAGARVAAHRLSYELSGEQIPDGLQLDHLCRNRECVNPQHLEPVSSRENTIRGEGPAGINARKTHCKRGHPLSGDNVVMVNTGRGRTGRRCVVCGVASGRLSRPSSGVSS